MMSNFNEKQVLFISAIGLLIASIFSVGYNNFDEHFQILEFAGAKLGLSNFSDLPWEYAKQMRSAFQPFIVYTSVHFFWVLGIKNPFFISFFLRLLSASLTFLGCSLVYKVFRGEFKNHDIRKWYLILSFLLWFLIYNGVRFASENWSGQLFVIGFSAYFLIKERDFISYIMIGAILGMSFLCRYQIALMILGFGLWLLFINKERFLNILTLTLGFTIIVIIGVVIDSWYYGEWTFSTWNYLNTTILNDVNPRFGELPWWWYFSKSLVSAVPPFSLIYVGGFLILLRYEYKSPVLWSIVPFLIAHIMIGHKELRFLYPIIGFIPYIAIKGYDVIINRFNSGKIKFRWFIRMFFIANSIALIIVAFKPADSNIALYQTLYHDYEKPITLYYVDVNPYFRVANINFYKRKTLEIKQIKSLDDIPQDKKSLLVLKSRHKINKLMTDATVYSSFPDWIKYFNINNWMSRANFWKVYELDYSS